MQDSPEDPQKEQSESQTEQPSEQSPSYDNETQSSNSNRIQSNPSSPESNVEPVNPEDVFQKARNIFTRPSSKDKSSKDKSDESADEDSSAAEDTAFLQYLKCKKRAKDLGLEDPSTVTFNQGGIHVSDSVIENSGSFTGNDQTTTGHSPEDRETHKVEKKGNDTESETLPDDMPIHVVFDQCNDLSDRCLMISLAALSGCNYRTVKEASEKLYSALKPEEQTLKDENTKGV